LSAKLISMKRNIIATTAHARTGSLSEPVFATVMSSLSFDALAGALLFQHYRREPDMPTASEYVGCRDKPEVIGRQSKRRL
jgi:hypothetical protein